MSCRRAPATGAWPRWRGSPPITSPARPERCSGRGRSGCPRRRAGRLRWRDGRVRRASPRRRARRGSGVGGRDPGSWRRLVSGARGREQNPPIAAPGSIADRALDGSFSGPLAGLRRRIYLTYDYLGWRTLLFRFVTFPLRFTPLRRRLRLRSATGHDATGGRSPGTRSTAGPVDVVIPSYRDADQVETLVRLIRKTAPADMVAGDRRRRRQRPRAPGRAARDRGHRGGRAASTTRASRPTSTAACGRRAADRDVVVLNSDIEARDRLAGVPAVRGLGQAETSASWVPSCCIRTGASSSGARFATSARPSGSTTATASSRPTGARRASPGPVLAVTGACMYVTRAS